MLPGATRMGVTAQSKGLTMQSEALTVHSEGVSLRRGGGGLCGLCHFDLSECELTVAVRASVARE